MKIKQANHLFWLVPLVLAIVLVNVPLVPSNTSAVNLHAHDEEMRAEILRKRHPVALVNNATIDNSDRYWRRALEEVDRSPEEIEAQSEREQRQGLNVPKLIRGNPSEKLLALTFDDGPHTKFTTRLLALLRREDVKATFFVVGKMVERHPDLLRAIARDGHLIGNHTFSHVTLTKIPLVEVRAEYEACNDIVEDVTGQQMRFCRPPGGDYDRHVVQAATEQGLTTVLWTDDPGDYASPGTKVIQEQTLKRLSNGGIILLHDGVEQTLQVLPQIIHYARDRGYRFVTVDELMNSVKMAAPMRELAMRSGR